MYKRQLIDHVTNVNGRTVETESTKYSDQLFSAKTASDVKEILLENGQNYTGRIPGYTLGIKSGTAPVSYTHLDVYKRQR